MLNMITLGCEKEPTDISGQLGTVRAARQSSRERDGVVLTRANTEGMERRGNWTVDWEKIMVTFKFLP